MQQAWTSAPAAPSASALGARSQVNSSSTSEHPLVRLAQSPAAGPFRDPYTPYGVNAQRSFSPGTRIEVDPALSDLSYSRQPIATASGNHQPIEAEASRKYIRTKTAEFSQIRYWKKEDAMNDPEVHPNPNVRHPVLRKVIEDLSGTAVTESRFGEIQAHVRTAANATLDLAISWTKQSKDAQLAFLNMAEELAEELRYCDLSRWKAIAMVRTFLDGKNRRARDESEGIKKRRDGTAEPEGLLGSVEQSSRKKRKAANGRQDDIEVEITG